MSSSSQPNPSQPSTNTTSPNPSSGINLTGGSSTNGPNQQSNVSDKDIQNVPKDAIIVEKILQSMGINEFEPRVIEQLLELVYRYITEVIEDSHVYMDHASRSDLDLEDIRLAIQTRVNHSYTEPPPVEFLLEVANQKNSQPILLPKKQRVLLPPQHHCLSNRNYQFAKSTSSVDDLGSRKRRKQQQQSEGTMITSSDENYHQQDQLSEVQQNENSLSSYGGDSNRMADE